MPPVRFRNDRLNDGPLGLDRHSESEVRRLTALKLGTVEGSERGGSLAGTLRVVVIASDVPLPLSRIDYHVEPSLTQLVTSILGRPQSRRVRSSLSLATKHGGLA